MPGATGHNSLSTNLDSSTSLQIIWIEINFFILIDQKGAYFRNQLSSQMSTPPLQPTNRSQQQQQGKTTWIFYLFICSSSIIFILCMENGWDWT